MKRLAILVLLACLLGGCSIIRNPANYQASIDIWHDASTAQVPVLEAEVARLRAAGEDVACVLVADTLVFAKYWAAYQRELDLAAAQLGEVTLEKPTDVPTPQDICGEGD
jgi:hypothetical protein